MPTALLLGATGLVGGHVLPLLRVAEELVRNGHRVRFLTGSRYRERVEETGARWLPLSPEADYDDRDMDEAFPGRRGRTGVAGIRWDLREIFLKPAPAQLADIDAALAAEPADAVLAESMFAGAMLLQTLEVEMEHIPYRGTGPALNDMLANRVQVFTNALAPMQPHIQAGSLRAIAIAGRRRSAAMPALPTTGEQGFPFLSDGPLAPAYLVWVAVWVAVIWGLTALSFSRRDV